MAPEMIVELRADYRSDIFSLGTVLYEMLTMERLFTGRTTAEILEKVVAGRVPPPSARNPETPAEVMAILRRALERDPAKRFRSAADMGEACEHYLYDKGYGPTNLTLKQYLAALLPEEDFELEVLDEPERFPVIEPSLFPIDDARPAPQGTPTRVAIPVSGTLPPGPVDRKGGSGT
jgi:serine/threonine-protein kinase